MQLLHQSEDPFLDESLLYIVQHAIEGPQNNTRIQVGSVPISCTADALAAQAITFDKPFKSTPIVLISKNPSVTSSVVTESYTNVTASGFTAQVYTSSTQSVTISYLAIGQV